MARGSFRQADIQRILRAAKATGSTVQIDIRTLMVTIFPAVEGQAPPQQPMALKPDGKENWEDEKPRVSMIDDILNRRDPYAPVTPTTPPMDWRESDVMEYLAGLGENERVFWRTIKNFGPSTQKKLEERGYIAISYEEGGSDRPNEVWLTEKGAKDWKAIKERYSRFR